MAKQKQTKTLSWFHITGSIFYITGAIAFAVLAYKLL